VGDLGVVVLGCLGVELRGHLERTLRGPLTRQLQVGATFGLALDRLDQLARQGELPLRRLDHDLPLGLGHHRALDRAPRGQVDHVGPGNPGEADREQQAEESAHTRA
jgi:hypothetical protein